MSNQDTYGVRDCFLGGPGLDGYSYQADVYCETCAKEIGEEVFAGDRRFDWIDFCDSDQVPQPIFFGESDCAQHCGACGEYLYGGSADEDDTSWGVGPSTYFDRFDIVEAHYWWLAHHHEGQGSQRYARLCEVSRYFRPGAAAHGPATENSQAIYANLCRRYGCAHEV